MCYTMAHPVCTSTVDFMINIVCTYSYICININFLLNINACLSLSLFLECRYKNLENLFSP
jgi:hypothetical protein